MQKKSFKKVTMWLQMLFFKLKQYEHQFSILPRHFYEYSASIFYVCQVITAL